MKLKSLLLGSAAALIAVTGARAADAVVADPEPVEYVRVCDMYGAGFFYIPGTETCLKIGGYVRVEYAYTSQDVPASTTVTPTAIAVGGTQTAGSTLVLAATATTAGLELISSTTAARSSTGAWAYRGRVNFDARNETDWGTLRSQLRFQGDGNGGADANAVVDRALVSVGGLQFGYSDQFFTTHHGYGWQKAANDGFYSYDQAIMLQYSYAANGFSATIGVQDELGTTAGAENVDIYGGVAYAGSWGRVAGSVINDGLSDDLAWKVSANISVIENLGINGWYANDDGKTRFVVGGAYNGAANGTTESEWGVDVNYQVADAVNVWVGYTAYDTTGVQEGHRIGVGAIWNPIPGLSVRPEAIFGEDTIAANTDVDYSQFRLRVVRSW